MINEKNVTEISTLMKLLIYDEYQCEHKIFFFFKPYIYYLKNKTCLRLVCEATKDSNIKKTGSSVWMLEDGTVHLEDLAMKEDLGKNRVGCTMDVKQNILHGTC